MIKILMQVGFLQRREEEEDLEDQEQELAYEPISDQEKEMQQMPPQLMCKLH